MRVLVTGGAGFIGSHVTEMLLGEGHEVVVIDNLDPFYASEAKRANLREIGARGSLEFHELDICDLPAMQRALGRHSFDAIFHLAARPGVRPSIQNPLLYESVNVRGTQVLLELARELGIPRFIFSSSSSVYGASANVPFREVDTDIKPISPYAATKLAAEKLCYPYAHLHGLRVVCLRLFTVYGPRQRPDLAIRKFIENIDAGRPIPVYGDGSSGRDYTYVGDTASGIVAALRYDAPWDVINLGNSHPVLLRELIAAIEACLGKKAVIHQLPDQCGDVPVTYADISRARAVLGYSPATSLSEGLGRMLEWTRAVSMR